MHTRAEDRIVQQAIEAPLETPELDVENYN